MFVHLKVVKVTYKTGKHFAEYQILFLEYVNVPRYFFCTEQYLNSFFFSVFIPGEPHTIQYGILTN